MPKVAIVDGCSIFIQFEQRAKHKGPHFHVYGNDWNASIRIDTLELSDGRLPANKRKAIMNFAREKNAELMRAYRQMQSGIHPDPIEE